MRIRKRCPPPPSPQPPPSSSSSSPPLVTVTPATAPDLPCKTPPDLQSQSLVGLLRLADLSVLASSRQSPPTPPDSPNPSLTQHPDLQLTITKGTNGWICAGTGGDGKPNCKAGSDCNCLHPIPSPRPTHLQNSQVGAAVVDNGGGTGGKHGENKILDPANNRINENNIGAATPVEISASPSLSHQGGRWCEGERAFPLKKRRGSFKVEGKLSEDTIMEKGKKMKTKVRRTKVAKKWVHEDDENEEKDDDDEKHEDGRMVNSNGAKKRRNGGLIMEGSRCSRVNGRGWRCCQQTLVGYSLCEHHLGKGRLRSMSSVRNRASTITNNRPNYKKEDESGLLSSSSSSTTTQCFKSLYEESEEEEDQKPPLMNTKKRKKIGMVKARSIRSLLGQTNQLAPAVTLRPSPDPPIGHNMGTPHE
ncbi:hypothetical protein NE237_009141 [Protea cynaroides]|uniref:WRC domain-containing protein n=1 Tax=Protea cynaroides TaxID=273540 RepID=A0A9Q0KXS3_9MAGN|nr:hypothetical protein NE237_009141 [Protea cynaroides]